MYTDGLDIQDIDLDKYDTLAGQTVTFNGTINPACILMVSMSLLFYKYVDATQEYVLLNCKAFSPCAIIGTFQSPEPADYPRAAAIAYAREGADVAINYLPAEEPDAQEVIALIKAEGRKAIAIPGDLRDEAFCKRLVEEALHGLGGLDIIVNNTGRQQAHASILDISTEQFDWTMKTNIYAPFWIIKAALPYLQPGSVIIGSTSEQATDPSEDLYDYAQTKAATTNYVRSLAKQLARKGIRVNGVAPGPIWTPLQVSGGATQEKLKGFGGDTPLGRPGQPVELGSIYVQLAASDASYATGQIYGSAGGKGMP
ncbi:SDR family oxidoreductase [Arcticibacter eurypsychrophilus]|uniref:SDR family oxidoreductase n=1 Tax=Arcticibacter eurypsychrophilus TaxID=1434752 RepID=UPI001FE21627|nr:SDR family oxidoreductase [Arcticibacter eurypsychrophilus]